MAVIVMIAAIIPEMLIWKFLYQHRAEILERCQGVLRKSLACFRKITGG